MTTKQLKRTVSLVLSSGGARGYAHIGIIEWLCENGFDIRSISGSSMGALIGGIYATGKLDIFKRWVRALERKDVISLLDFSFGRSGLFKGERIINVLKDLIGNANIEELSIAFTAVATDLDTGKEVWLNKGALFDAIRASIAIPTIFTPYKYNGKLLLDGGLVNPIPIAPTNSDITDITIAVNVSAKMEVSLDKFRVSKGLPPEKKYQHAIADFVEGLRKKRGQSEHEDMGFFDIISKAYDSMQSTIARFKLAAYSPDIIIDIPKNICGFFEFERADEIIEIGRSKAVEVLGHMNES